MVPVCLTSTGATIQPNLFVIPAGPVTPRTWELLSSSLMQHLLGKLVSRALQTSPDAVLVPVCLISIGTKIEQPTPKRVSR